MANPAQISPQEVAALRARNKRLEKAFRDISRDPDNAWRVVDDLEEDLGVAKKPLTLEDIKEMTPEQVADRWSDVEDVLSGKPTGSSGPVTADDVRRMTDEQVADVGAEEALAIVNAESDNK